MRKKALALGTFLFICGFLQEILAQTEEETLTITTYYPAPYGVYNEMRAKRMAVGTNYYNGSAYPWDTGGGCAGNEICNADLVVQGNVGIGTTNPNSPLHVIGTVNAEAFQAFETNGAYAFMERGIDNDGIVQFGGFNVATTSFTDTRIDGVPLVLQSRSGGNVGIGTANPQAKLDIINEVGDGIMFGTPNVRRWKLELGNGAPLNIKDVTGNYLVAQFGGNWGTSDIYLWPHDSVGIGSTPMPIGPSYKLYVAGAVYATGGFSPSDSRFKHNIMAINNPLDKILSLKGISFEWEKEEYKEKNFPEGRHFGVIGQEIEKVLPEIVNLDQDGSRNVNYQEIIPVLIEAVKEQQAQIYALGEELKELKRK